MKRIKLKTHSSIRLTVYDFGGSGDPLLFCHFTGGLGLLWKPIALKLTKHFHCFAFDARGHGYSDKPLKPEDYAWEEHLNDLISVIDFIIDYRGKVEFFGVGHSFGGACLTQAVVRTKNKVKWQKLILIEPIIAPTSFDLQKQKMAQIAEKRRYKFASESELQNSLRNKYPYIVWDSKLWNIYKQHGFQRNKEKEFTLRCAPQIESFQYLLANPPHWFENLKKIKVPTLIMYGQKSELLPLSNFQLSQIQNSYLIIFPEVTHFLPQEKPLLTSDWIKRWFLAP